MERLVRALAGGGRVLGVSGRDGATAGPATASRERAARRAVVVAASRSSRRTRRCAGSSRTFAALADAAAESPANPLPASIEVRLRADANRRRGRCARAADGADARRRRCALRPPLDSTADERGVAWSVPAALRWRRCSCLPRRSPSPASSGSPCSRGAKRFTSCSSSARRWPTSAGRSSSRDSSRGDGSDRGAGRPRGWRFSSLRSRAGALLGGAVDPGSLVFLSLPMCAGAACRRDGRGMRGGLIAARQHAARLTPERAKFVDMSNSRPLHFELRPS